MRRPSYYEQEALQGAAGLCGGLDRQTATKAYHRLRRKRGRSAIFVRKRSQS